MTKRDVAVALVSAAIVVAAMYYGGPVGSKVAEKVVIPAVAERIREPGARFNLDKPVVLKPAPVVIARCETPDVGYYRALLRDGVFPVIRHEARP